MSPQNPEQQPTLTLRGEVEEVGERLVWRREEGMGVELAERDEEGRRLNSTLVHISFIVFLNLLVHEMNVSIYTSPHSQSGPTERCKRHIFFNCKPSVSLCMHRI